MVETGGSAPANGQSDEPLLVVDQVGFAYQQSSLTQSKSAVDYESSLTQSKSAVDCESSLTQSKSAVDCGHGSGPAMANRVLHGLSFSIGKGELVCVLGPSGCGKSTLVQLLAGFLTPTEGSITMNGIPVTGPGTDRALVPQQTSLYPWLTVIQNVALPLKVQGVDYAERMRRAESALAMVGLAPVKNVSPRRLSGGMQQRVMVARALVQQARLLLMDEPFGALDALTRERLQLELLRVWRETGLTVLLITHDVDEAALLATHALVMGAGPGRVIAALDLGFGRQLVDGHRSHRTIRNSQAFAAARQFLRDQLGA